MSDNFDRLQTYIERLREQAKVEKNDVRHRHYAGYINQFISEFCNERVYLVGSTGENLKLRWSKNGGDADFLLCTGMFEIPVENLQFRADTPCYVWLKSDGLESKINFDLIDDKYIPTGLLRSVSTEFFTILRGIYLIVTSTLDTVPGRQSRVTTTGLPSRVGLARTEYRNLKIPDDRMANPSDNKNEIKRLRTDKPKTERYGKDVVIHKKDKEIMDSIINMIVFAKTRESTGSHDGQFRNFAHVMNIVQKRRQDGQAFTIGECKDDGAEDVIISHEKSVQDEGQSTPEVKRNRQPLTKPSTEEFKQILSDVEGTYEERTSKDFVPAIRVKGMLKFMADWENRNGFWPKTEDRHRISKCDVFVVSRYAPVAPDTDKDFCLSFNLAEMELARCMSQVQRDVFLILKSYLKGGFQASQDAINPQAELKLKTFHLKTALYWVSEREDPEIWKESNIKEALLKVLRFIAEAVMKGRLDHYFVPENNLFADLEEKDLDFIRKCMDQAIADPINYIHRFFDLDDGKPVKIQFTEDELNTLLEMREDGGLAKQADLIEEAIIDFHRGFNEGPRDANGNAPIVDAIKKTGERYLQDAERGELADLQENHDLAKARSQLTTLVGTLKLTQATNTTGDLSNLIRRALGSGLIQSHGAPLSNRESNGESQESQIETVRSEENTHQGSGVNTDAMPTSSRQSSHSRPGEKDTGKELLADALTLLAGAHNMDRESRRGAEDELKSKALSFFLGKPH